MDKLIITVAPTGNVPTRENSPYLPLAPDEIADDIYRCYKSGASVAHIHARDEKGDPTADPQVFRAIVEQVRQRCDIIVQLSTGARAGRDAAERGACIDLKPEMASLATGSSNFARSVNYNPPDLIKELAGRMVENRVKPEIEVFDLAMLEHALYLVDKGLLEEPLHINLVLGVPGSLSGTARNLSFLVESLPENCTWMATAIGKCHRPITTLAMAMGGHVRSGLEDVTEFEAGKPLSNQELVENLVRVAGFYGRQPANPAEARKIFSLD